MRLRYFLPLLATMVLACSHETPMAPDRSASDGSDVLNGAVRELPLDQVDKMLDLKGLADSPDGGVAAMSRGSNTVHIPSGSVDALSGALAAAGPRGTVILEPGLHTESGTVTISAPVTLIGLEGAVLQVDTQPFPDTTIADPALYVVGTSNVRIWNVELRAAGVIGGVGILLENTRGVVIGSSRISDFQYPVILEQADHTRIWRNTIVTSNLWITGAAEAGHGITVVNGDHVRIRENDVSGGFFGIWACDEAGQLTANFTHDNYVGIILCKVPAVLPLPSGNISGSEKAAQGWITTDNVATHNFDVGYFVTDGSNNNFLINNKASNNSLATGRDVDLEVLGDSFFFGFLTPAAYDNTIVAGSESDLVAVDCGIDTQFYGVEPVELECR